MSDFKSNTPISYWAFPGMATTESAIQSSGNYLLPSPIRVIHECMAKFDVTEEEFWGTRRIQRIVNARKYSSFIMFHFCGWSFVRLAKFFTKDRTTLMHHVHSLEGSMEMYPEERAIVYELLEQMHMINTSSSGSTWFKTWVDEQLKSIDTYHKILKMDTVDALNEIIAITHKDGRGMKGQLEDRDSLVPLQTRMSTVKDAWAAERRRVALDKYEKQCEIDAKRTVTMDKDAPSYYDQKY